MKDENDSFKEDGLTLKESSSKDGSALTILKKQRRRIGVTVTGSPKTD